ncbi:unnamed protein product [Rotaria magnacalcarata]|uniref:beta-N-acetylhexosaminidase n=1 Tax=Rotaria magnacalcarata TaxID=392030 RepID=A0A816SN68_9BILA|nr:unnamed protein product [Rotaria magnacalcarata]
MYTGQRLFLISFSIAIVLAEIQFLAVRLPLQGQPSPPNAVWPHPQQMTVSKDLLYIRPHDLKIDSNIQSCDIIAKAIQRYEPIFFPPKLAMNSPPSSANNILQSLTLNIPANSQCEKYIQQNSNESYTLNISRQIATVEATTVWGLLRGLETFSQLIYIDQQNYVVINDSVTIVDSPRFQHRGIMLDCARHFLPVSIIKKNLDVMTYNKLNVFHWHLVDDQSFPFQSTTFPNLSRTGAFTPDHVYTPADVSDVIEHARLRGIRVIPEIDTPGHTYSWRKAMPELITVCWADGKPYQAIYGTQGEMEIFNPIEPRVYSTMDALLREVKSRFPSNFIHLGMDEVYDKCWLSNPTIKEWMTDHSINSSVGLHTFYADRILNITRNIDVTPIVWQDVWDEKVELPPGTIIQVWKDSSDQGVFGSWAAYLNQAANEGYNVILSSPWYINYISYGKYDTNASVMNLEFFKYYEVEPMRGFTGSDEAKKRILGGEACLWGEFVDGTNILARLWPKASAVAERLWSAASGNKSEDAQFRLDVHRCRLLRRGIPAQPILNGYCGNYEVVFVLICVTVLTSGDIEFLAVRLPLKGQPSPPNAVWPHPQQMTVSDDLLYIRPHDLKIDSNIRSCDIIAKAIQRYEPIFFPPKFAMNSPPPSANNILQSLTLNIPGNSQCEQYIQQNSNESCKFSENCLILNILCTIELIP